MSETETVYDILRTFALRKNVEMGMTQVEWVEFINELEYLMKGRE